MTPTLLDSLARIPLAEGLHDSPEGRLCVMECVAYVMGAEHSDHPACACPIVTSVAIYANDERLKECGPALAKRILRLAGSKRDLDTQIRRVYFLADFLFRTVLPSSLGIRHAALALQLSDLKALESFDDLDDLAPLVEALEATGLPFAPACRMVTKDIEHGRFREAADNITVAFTEAEATFDVVALLDQLMAIGEAPAVTMTHDLERRILELANRGRPVKSHLTLVA